MNTDEPEYFLFIGNIDDQSATTKLRSSRVLYAKKLLSSKPENWDQIVAMIASPGCRAALVVLRHSDYEAMCQPEYEETSRALLDALATRSHMIFVHEAVFLTDEQRAVHDERSVHHETEVDVPIALSDEERVFFDSIPEDTFGAISDATRDRVNAMLRDRHLNVVPYRTNVERSVIASGFLEDNERHLLFRFYVPSGRLYAQEADNLLGMFREWLGQTGHSGVRQEGYSTAAGQVFEFFSKDGQPEGGLSRTFEEFSSFLWDCTTAPSAAADRLIADGVTADNAPRLVSRYAIRAKRLHLDLQQRREESLLSLKHQHENVVLELGSSENKNLGDILDALLPPPTATGVIEGPKTPPDHSLTVNNFNPQFNTDVTGSIVQNIDGTVNLGTEAKQLLELAATFGGHERAQLETAVHEMEDDGARGAERLAARGRLKRFLADLGNRGLGVGLDILQRYIEHKIGVP